MALEKLRNCTKCGKRGRFGVRYSHLAVDDPGQKTQPRCATCRNAKPIIIIDRVRKTVYQLRREYRAKTGDMGLRTTAFMLSKLK